MIGTVMAAVLLGPTLSLLALATLAGPAAQTNCSIEPGLVDVPDALTATTATGRPVSLNEVQLGHARTIIVVGRRTEGVTNQGIVVALTAAITESDLRMLSNPTAYPDSTDYPNDGHGSDHDSLGLFQMRPRSGWGTVAELMDAEYQAQAFYGGPDGPNLRSPPGLLDLPDWRELSIAQAAQAVERSAHPQRYADNEPVARAALAALTTLDQPAPWGPAASPSPIPDGPADAAVDPQDPLATDAAAVIAGPNSPGAGCPTGTGAPPLPFRGIPDVRLADPTGTDGFVTSQLAHLITETKGAFGEGSWACWSPRPGTKSEHPLGRACDITFSNRIGTLPNNDQIAQGWQMATWLQAHADALHVEYLIWQGQIWSRRRADEGWRAYDGGGMHDPTDPTGGHYDHLHVTVRG